MIRLRHPQLCTSIILAAIAGASGCGGTPAAEPAADPYVDAARNIGLVGHNDLQGRE